MLLLLLLGYRSLPAWLLLHGLTVAACVVVAVAADVGGRITHIGIVVLVRRCEELSRVVRSFRR